MANQYRFGEMGRGGVPMTADSVSVGSYQADDFTPETFMGSRPGFIPAFGLLGSPGTALTNPPAPIPAPIPAAPSLVQQALNNSTQRSIPYPVAPFPSTQPGMTDFNQMAFNLASPQPAMSRDMSFIGPQYGIVGAANSPEERSRWQSIADPLGLFPTASDRSNVEQLLDPGNVAGLLGF